MKNIVPRITIYSLWFFFFTFYSISVLNHRHKILRFVFFTVRTETIFITIIVIVYILLNRNYNVYNMLLTHYKYRNKTKCYFVGLLQIVNNSKILLLL